MKINQAVILAAGQGTRMEGAIGTRPKCLIELNGKTLLERTIDKLYRLNFEHIHIVIGFEKDQIIDHLRNRGYVNVKHTENKFFSERGSMYSLTQAFMAIHRPAWVFDADLFFDENIFYKISNLDIDSTFLTNHSGSNDETVPVFKNGYFQEFKKVRSNDNPEMLGIALLRAETIQMMSEIDFLYGFKLSYESALSKVVIENNLPLNLLYVPEYIWSDVDNQNDLERLEKILADNEY